MAVEAGHMNLLSSQLVTNRDLINNHQGFGKMGNTQMESGLVLPGLKENQSLLPFHKSVLPDPVSTQRKRSRDSMNEMIDLPVSQKSKVSSLSALIDQDVIYQLRQQQAEFDFVIAQHTEKIRLGMEEHRRRQTKALLSSIQDTMGKKLKEKEEVIQKMGKINWVLLEKVKSLSMENQLWRDLAQTNEATVMSLRSNLEQVLAHASDDHRNVGPAADDVESSCGSSGGGEAESGARMCRKCGEREASVVLLPCRHLCVCTMCGSTLHSCPVCECFSNASVHVNMS